MQGRIKMHRKITERWWYKHPPTRSVFIHLILWCNHAQKTFQGILVKAWQIITWRKKLSQELGHTENQIRGALINLQNTWEITIKTTNKYSLITLLNYTKYQHSGKEITNKNTIPITNKSPTNHHKQECKERKNEKKRGVFEIPSKQSVQEYIRKNWYWVDCDAWMNHYETNWWKVWRNKMKSREASVRSWQSRLKSEAMEKYKNLTPEQIVDKYGKKIYQEIREKTKSALFD